MSFESTYQLISPIGESPEALSYRAVIKMTGEEVWIHIIRPDSTAVFELARKQFSAASFGDKPILEVMQEGVKSIVVTRPLPPGATLVDWLRSLGEAKTPDPLTQAGAFQYTGFAPPPPPPPQVMPQVMQPPPIFETQQMPAYGKSPQQPPPNAPMPPPTPAPTAVPTQPQPTDEFARMFQEPPAPVAASAAPSFTAAPHFAPPPQPTKQEPGEFTRMFQSPLMDHTPAPINPITNPIAPPPSQQVGEFTRMFKAINAPSVMPLSISSPATPAAGPGDFTRLLQTPSAGAMNTPPVAPPPFGGGTAMPGSMPTPTPQAPHFAPPPSQYSPAPQSPGQSRPAMPTASAPGASGSSSPSNRSPIGAPSYAAPSVSMSGIGAPSISSSGQLNGPHIGMPSFSAGHISAPSLYSGGSFSLDDLPGFGPGSSGQPANVAAPAAGPLSAGNAPMNPNALSSGDGATSFFKAQQNPARPTAAQAPAQAGPGDYTRMMQAPPAASAPAVGVPLPKSNTPPPAPAPLFSQPVVPAAAPAPPAVPHPSPAAPGGFLKGISPWLIIGNVVILLMIATLVYVVVRSSH